jgi:predicted nucleic acid-binding protein
MTIVLDVSAAVALLLRKPGRERFAAAYAEASWVIAPELYIAELTNTFWKYYKAGVLSREDCARYAEDGIALVDQFLDAGDLWKEALGEGMKQGHSVYDLYYAVLARRYDASLLTDDERLGALCSMMNVDVISAAT